MTPDKYTNQELMLDVGDGHAIYVHDWGSKDANTPIVVLHGGPGYGFSDRHKKRFDPTIQRVIFHDQRGVGKSTPYGSCDHNTTKHLVEDIEKIAKFLRLNSFTLTGGSWGSTLALAYTLQYPKRVKSLVISGIYTGSQQETDYLHNGLYRTHFPDVWQRLLDKTPTEHHGNPLGYHLERMFGSNEGYAKESAQAYIECEAALSSLDDRFSSADPEEFDPLPAKLEAHYLQNGCFFSEDRYILNNAHNITIPTWIVQGRYDFVCPPITAFELSNKIPKANLLWTQGGHSSSDRNTYEVLQSLLLQASQS